MPKKRNNSSNPNAQSKAHLRLHTPAKSAGHASHKGGSELESLLHSEHIVKIEKLAVGGHGIARINHKDRKVAVFVSQSAPDDKVKIKITAADKNFLTALIVETIEPSPSRVNPPCKYVAECGGCPWQHIHEKSQIAQKELILKDLFSKFLPQTAYTLETTVTSPKQFEYRNRIQLKQLGRSIGFFKPESHDIVDIEDCLIAETPLREWFKTHKAQVKPSDKLKKYELKLNSEHKVEFYPIGTKSEGLAFAQVNQYVNDLLINKTLEFFKTIHPKSLTEFYAGSGNFTFPIAHLLTDTKIDAIELNPDLTQKATDTIKSLKLHKRIRFYTTKSEFFPLRQSISQDMVMLDPPRQGCEKLLLEKIADTAPQYILYISCHPVSLVRDLQVLQKNGYNFEIKHLQIFDMFPQTDHFETLCLLKKS
ncbi:MAG: class I SAM-dependent RNA methyltransferase [Pseudobdellovibrio sp.]